MLSVLACLLGIFALLVLNITITRKRLLKPEYQRKLVHMTSGVFIASWPWIISWRQIQLIGLMMLAVVTINRHRTMFHFSKNIRRETYGDYFFAIAVVICAMLTHSKIFFAIAMLNLALADGLAAVIGKNFGLRSKYQVFGHAKTVLGSMTFWLVSLLVFAIGVLFAYNQISFYGYVLILVAVPPLLTLLENFAILGVDNLLVPVAVILALRFAQTF